MKKNIFINLEWLKKPDQLFIDTFNGFKKNKFSIKLFEKLNPYYIDFRRSQSLNKIAFKYQGKLLESGNYEIFNLGIISNVNFDILLPSLRAYTLKNYVYLNCYPAPFGQTINFIKSKKNFFKNRNLDAVLVALDYTILNYPKSKNKISQTFKYIKDIVKLVNSEIKKPCIIQSMVNTSTFTYGNLDFLMNDSHRYITNEINSLIKKELTNNSYNLIFDSEKISSILGTDIWSDESLFNLTKSPLSMPAIPVYSYYLSSLIGSIKGKSKRLAILDLDNTLWGGVFGDLGIEKVEIGKSSPLGEAFTNFQKYLLLLRERGILLAIASKNDSITTMQAINSHPEMLIKEEHLSAYEINWKDKAQNIINICNKVNLGPQSAVFIDDNPFERNLVRNLLPAVSVPELPTDPSYFIKYLGGTNYFETTFFSKDDKIRGNFFSSEKNRLNLKKHLNDVDKYLSSLKMKAEVRCFQRMDFKRLEQLINKSNQFNLTTKRYDYRDVENISKRKDFVTLQVRLSDIYGENGIIGIIILKLNKEHIYIDTWIQSCRILERKVEFLILDQIICCAKTYKVKFILGKYIKTNKNKLVKYHYKKLGFEKTDDDSADLWKLDIKKYKKDHIPIKLIIN